MSPERRAHSLRTLFFSPTLHTLARGGTGNRPFYYILGERPRSQEATQALKRAPLPAKEISQALKPQSTRTASLAAEGARGHVHPLRAHQRDRLHPRIAKASRRGVSPVDSAGSLGSLEGRSSCLLLVLLLRRAAVSQGTPGLGPVRKSKQASELESHKASTKKAHKPTSLAAPPTPARSHQH